MPLVKMKTTYCNARAFCDPGKVINLSKDEAAAVIEAKAGVAVATGTKVEIGAEPRNVAINDRGTVGKDE